MNGVHKLRNALKQSVNGLLFAIRHEVSFQAELVLGPIIYSSVAYYIWPISVIEFLIMLGSYLLILSAELFNTSIEQALNEIHPEQSEVIKISKDTASAAVFISIIFASAVLISLVMVA